MAVSQEIRDIIRKRQIVKREAIRETPIYDRELQIPLEGRSLRCLEYWPDGMADETLPAVLDFHGGGFTNGYAEEDDLFCRRTADVLPVRVLSFEYRLAPDHPYPEGSVDVYETILHVLARPEEFRIDPKRFVLTGHSAGATLAMSALLRSIDCAAASGAHAAAETAFRPLTGDISPLGLIMDYAPLDVATPGSEKEIIGDLIPGELAELFNRCYCLKEQAEEPYCSPFFATDDQLKQLPPTTFISCELDTLRKEDEELALRCARLGVEVTLKRFQGQQHGFTCLEDTSATAAGHGMMIRCIKSYLGL